MLGPQVLFNGVYGSLPSMFWGPNVRLGGMNCSDAVFQMVQRIWFFSPLTMASRVWGRLLQSTTDDNILRVCPAIPTRPVMFQSPSV